MGGFKAKIVFLLVVYFAGFATAIYCLVPVDENQEFEGAGQGLAASAIISDEFAKSFNTGIHKCIDFGKDTAVRTAEFLKEKYKSRQQNRDG